MDKKNLNFQKPVKIFKEPYCKLKFNFQLKYTYKNTVNKKK